jgi:hypothetical protein
VYVIPLAEDLAEQNTRDNAEIAHIQELLTNELSKRNIEINEKTMHKKYLVWNILYSKRNKIVHDNDIIKCIEEVLKTILS